MKKELKKKIRELEPYLNSAKTINGNKIVDVYNEWKGANPRTGRLVPYTGCGSCLRKYLNEMVKALKSEEEKKKEKKKEDKVGEP